MYELSEEEFEILRLHREQKSARDDMIAKYSTELGLHTPFTLDTLIDSHRRLRQMMVEDQEARRAAINTAYEKAFEQALEEARQREVFSRERLLEMPLKELVEYLSP
jgi:hypothetical protein